MEGEEWVRGIREDLHWVISSPDKLTWEDAKKRYVTRTEVENIDVFLTAMVAYTIGRKRDDKSLVQEAERIAGIRISDVGDRLPWYNTMFEIMERGTFHGGVLGIHYFELEEKDKSELTDHLARETKLKPHQTQEAVDWLSRELGEIPGTWYALQLGRLSRSSHPYEKTVLICRYLHKPMERLNGRTAADFHLDDLRAFKMYRRQKH